MTTATSRTFRCIDVTRACPDFGTKEGRITHTETVHADGHVEWRMTGVDVYGDRVNRRGRERRAEAFDLDRVTRFRLRDGWTVLD